MQEFNIIFYSNTQGDVNIDIRFEDGTFWLTQKKLAALFGVETQTIDYHLSEIYKSGELKEGLFVRKFQTKKREGNRQVNRELIFYSLEVILAVSYRVNSYEATQFRIWATNILKEFLVKGFVLDDDRLKQGQQFGKDYFDQLLERIRSIRASERRFYQKITDIYTEASIDYDKEAPVTHDFYKELQNKLHHAITGNTAAELIASRANAKLPNMGLTTWRDSPNGKIQESDTYIAKNYLREDELKQLENIATMYLDYAESQALNKQAMTMKDWEKKLDDFLKFNEYEILSHSGKVSIREAKEIASAEYKKFFPIQDQNFSSDFDKLLLRNGDIHKA